MRVLVTGGAGFIGSHVVDELVERGHTVHVLDNLDPQVHPSGRWPDYLNPNCDLWEREDIRDEHAVRLSLRRIEAVVHLAAKVGVGQAQYDPASYSATNCLGTAVLLKQMMMKPIKRLVVASSMSIYGEGNYAPAASTVYGHSGKDGWYHDKELQHPVAFYPVPTPETATPDPRSIYAITKYTTEMLALAYGRAYNVPTAALRFFNTYGPRQKLGNPYTGVGAIFASRFLAGKQPAIFEDGEQTRDFIHVSDVARAVANAVERDSAVGPINIGTGVATSVRRLATLIARHLHVPDDPHITNEYRSGDVRHCYADVQRARDLLDWEAKVSIEDGVRDLCLWAGTQTVEDDGSFDGAFDELAMSGLLKPYGGER